MTEAGKQAAKVSVYQRKPRVPDDADVKAHPFQADIMLPNGDNHHGVGSSPEEAVFRAAGHWMGYEARQKDATFSTTPTSPEVSKA